jgi:hypothetical protein
MRVLLGVGLDVSKLGCLLGVFYRGGADLPCYMGRTFVVEV